MDTSFPRFLINGDSVVSTVFDDQVSEEISRKIHAFQLLLAARHIPGLIETVPTYCALIVHYDPCLLSYEELLQKLRALANEIDLTALPPNKILEIPVLYGGEMGPGLAHVIGHTGISEAEAIKLHSEPEYLIYMLGFAPGFTYLSGLNPKLETPRLETPRVLIPASSAGIASERTGVYPIASPGGWQPISRTPIRMYDPDREAPVLPRAGQYIRFLPITEEEYREAEAEIETGICRLNIRKREEAKA